MAKSQKNRQSSAVPGKLNIKRRPPAMTSILKMLKKARAPTMLALLVSHMFLTFPASELTPKNDHVETFAGEQAVTQAWLADNCVAPAFDIKISPLHDINSDIGFLLTLKEYLRLKPDLAGALMAPVCSTFVNLNMGFSKRSLHRPLGDISQAKIQNANLMVSRVMLLCWLLASIGVCFWLEQPSGSWMEKLPRFMQLCKHFKLHRKCINMSVYLSD